ncbi:MAG: ATP-binding protein [Oscillospiraceae bacterium]|nr:ATP-binding protein [Oscillospiraceae bacterium]
MKVYFGGFVAENEPPALEQLLPATVKFNVDHYIRSDRYCCAWALKDYPPSTDMQALFAQLADRAGVTLRICNRPVESHEQRKILQNATRKNRFAAHANDAQESINAEENLHDVATLLANLRRNREPLLHCAVFLELHAVSLDKLRELQQEINMELTRSKLGVDRLTLRQQDGFLSAWPCGFNQFDAQFERVLPASSVANFYPLNYSGKTDPAGFYIGRDTFGTNILVDFDRRAEDKSNANILILGNSGQGKSYLMKLVLANLRAAGKRVFALDAEAEYEDLTHALGGCYVDLTDGSFRINPLDPRGDLKEHIAYLKDFFRAYKDFSDEQIDTIELLLGKLYAKNESPTMSDFYVFIEQEHARKGDELYSSEVLSELLLSLHSMCRGAESKFFDGYTNVTDSDFLCFGVKGLMGVNQRLRDALLFNLLSFMSHALLVRGNTVAAIDEIYLYLNNQTAIEYIRNCMKRVRKQESAMILATQNISDFLIPAVKEYTKPLFAIPTHQFLFYPGNIDPRDFTDTLQLEQAEFDLIRQPKTGHCLFKCGNERYYLHVIAPEHKRAMFGSGGGR